MMGKKKDRTAGQEFLAAVVSGVAATTGVAAFLATLSKVNPVLVEALLRAFAVL